MILFILGFWFWVNMWPENQIPAFFTQAYWTLSRAKIMWPWTVVYLGSLSGLSLHLPALFLRVVSCQTVVISYSLLMLLSERKWVIRGYTLAKPILVCFYEADRLCCQRRLWLTHRNGFAHNASTTLDPRTRSLLVSGDVINLFILDNYDVLVVVGIASWLPHALF